MQGRRAGTIWGPSDDIKSSRRVVLGFRPPSSLGPLTGVQPTSLTLRRGLHRVEESTTRSLFSCSGSIVQWHPAARGPPADREPTRWWCGMREQTGQEGQARQAHLAAKLGTLGVLADGLDGGDEVPRPRGSAAHRFLRGGPSQRPIAASSGTLSLYSRSGCTVIAHLSSPISTVMPPAPSHRMPSFLTRRRRVSTLGLTLTLLHHPADIATRP